MIILRESQSTPERPAISVAQITPKAQLFVV